MQNRWKEGYSQLVSMRQNNLRRLSDLFTQGIRVDVSYSDKVQQLVFFLYTMKK